MVQRSPISGYLEAYDAKKDKSSNAREEATETLGAFFRSDGRQCPVGWR